MTVSSKQNYDIKIEESEYAIIKLGKSVLGGNEALVFTQELNDISTKNVRFVIVDLLSVETMNSSGLGMLVSGLTTLKKHGIELYLASIPSKVMYLLKMTHLDNVFKIYETVDEALKS